MQIGFEVTAAKSKRDDAAEAPAQEPMRPTAGPRRNPSAEDKARRQLARTAAGEATTCMDCGRPVEHVAQGWGQMQFCDDCAADRAAKHQAESDAYNRRYPAGEGPGTALIEPQNVGLLDEAYPGYAEQRARQGVRRQGVRLHKHADSFWDAVGAQYEELRSAKTADDVLAILSNDRNPYGDSSMSAGQGFWAGSGGDSNPADALRDAGWRINYIEGEYHWEATPPGGGDGIEYVEGDIYRKTGSMKRQAFKIEDVQKIVDTKSFGEVDGQPLDTFSASAILAVYNALKDDANRQKLLSFSVGKAAEVCFKMLNKKGSRTAAGAPITDSQSTWTLNPDDERWIGNFTDSALDEAFEFWTSDAGRNAQPYIPGYADSMSRMITEERTRRGGSLSREAQILAAIPKATPAEQVRLASELDMIRSARRTAAHDRHEHAAGAEMAAIHLTPVFAHVHHSNATDWLAAEAPERTAPEHIVQAARAEATVWARRVHAAVREDREEYLTQAQGYAETWGGRYGLDARSAAVAFVDWAAHLGGFRRDAGDKGPAWFEDNVYSDKGPHSSGAPGGGIPIHGPLSDEQQAWMDKGRSKPKADDEDDEMPKAARRVRADQGMGPDDDSQSGFAETALDTVDVDEATKDTNMGWIGGTNADDQTFEDQGNVTARRRTAARSTTIFKICPAHEGTFAGMSRSRKAEFFGEGGPGYGGPCKGEGCKIKPGTDLFVPELCDAEYDTKSGSRFEWEVNAKTASRRTAADGATCADCGASIERDPEGETNRSWHHNDGSTHDHEAKPSSSKEGRRQPMPAFMRQALRLLAGDDAPPWVKERNEEEGDDAPAPDDKDDTSDQEPDGDADDADMKSEQKKDAHRRRANRRALALDGSGDDEYDPQGPGSEDGSKPSGAAPMVQPGDDGWDDTNMGWIGGRGGDRVDAWDLGPGDSSVEASLRDDTALFEPVVPPFARKAGYDDGYYNDADIEMSQLSEPDEPGCPNCGATDTFVNRWPGKENEVGAVAARAGLAPRDVVICMDCGAVVDNRVSRDYKGQIGTIKVSRRTAAEGDPNAWRSQDEPGVPFGSHPKDDDEDWHSADDDREAGMTASRRTAGAGDWYIMDREGVVIFEGPFADPAEADIAFREGGYNDRCIVGQGWEGMPGVGGISPEASQKTAMPAPADVGVELGSIFYSSWGYDQTNVSFYEVVRLMGASVSVREVAKDREYRGSGSTYVTPRKGEFIGAPMTKRLQTSGYKGAAITISSSETAWLWDGKPQYETESGWGH